MAASFVAPSHLHAGDAEDAALDTIAQINHINWVVNTIKGLGDARLWFQALLLANNREEPTKRIHNIVKDGKDGAVIDVDDIDVPKLSLPKNVQ